MSIEKLSKAVLYANAGSQVQVKKQDLVDAKLAEATDDDSGFVRVDRDALLAQLPAGQTNESGPAPPTPAARDREIGYLRKAAGDGQSKTVQVRVNALLTSGLGAPGGAKPGGFATVNREKLLQQVALAEAPAKTAAKKSAGKAEKATA